jgi:glyoxylase I family protein
MPPIVGQVVILTVSDVGQSAAWYRDLLDMDETSRYVEPDGHVALVHLLERLSGVEVCLVNHRSGQAAFDEFRIGLDHLEFLVAHRDDLDNWVTPDNIQLEFFWQAPRS